MTRNGKIARLPKALREELNRRLDDGHTGAELVAWLNERPEVRQTLAEKFGGRPISVQNISGWKNGGFLDWAARQEIVMDAGVLNKEPAKLREVAKGRLRDQMETILASRYAKILGHWRGEVTEDLTQQLRTLQELSRGIVHLGRREIKKKNKILKTGRANNHEIRGIREKGHNEK